MFISSLHEDIEVIAFGDVSCDQAFEIDTTRVAMEVMVIIFQDLQPYRAYNPFTKSTMESQWSVASQLSDIYRNHNLGISSNSDESHLLHVTY